MCKLMVDPGLKEPKTGGPWAIPAVQAVAGGPRGWEVPGATSSTSLPPHHPLVPTNKLLEHIHATRCLCFALAQTVSSAWIFLLPSP